MRRFLSHIRTKLALWHVATMGVVLLVYSASASLLLLHHLRTQLIRYAVQDLETVEGLLHFDKEGILRFRDDYHNHPESSEVFERLLEVRSPEGTLLYRNPLLGNRALGGIPFAEEGKGGYSPRPVVLEDGTHVQLVSRRHAFDGRPTVIRLAYSEDPLWQHFRDEFLALLIPLPFVLALAGAIGYLLAARTLQPIHQMALRAEKITGDHLHARLPVDGADGELAELAAVFNGMLARLEQSFEQLRRFTSDASHELRTPLTAIRSVGEVGLQKHGTAEAYRDVIGSMLEEVNRLTQLVDTLFTISRADARQILLKPTTFPVRQLVDECSGLLGVLMEERGQRLTITGERDVWIRGDWLLLRQGLFNVVHNAIKYSSNGTEILIRVLLETPGQVRIEVVDSGPGIPPPDLEKVFDRFYRVDSARSRETGGVGLGLAIAKWAAEAHGGTIRAWNLEGSGSVFSIELPTLSATTGSNADALTA